MPGAPVTPTSPCEAGRPGTGSPPCRNRAGNTSFSDTHQGLQFPQVSSGITVQPVTGAHLRESSAAVCKNRERGAPRPLILLHSGARSLTSGCGGAVLPRQAPGEGPSCCSRLPGPPGIPGPVAELCPPRGCLCGRVKLFVYLGESSQERGARAEGRRG